MRTCEDEFQIIDRYFRAAATARDDVTVGIGDDGAVVRVPPDRELVIAVDTLVAGRHFPDNCAPADVGWKALAVNLSDLAAMGAEPAWCTIALTLPGIDADWLAGFANGFSELARAHGIALVGGDLTRGPLTVSVGVHGLVPPGAAMRRAGARPGDRVCVTGTLGDAALALTRLGDAGFAAGTGQALLERLHRPAARVAAGLHLRGLASAAVDISDGLLADLGHVLTASGVGARLRVDRLPRSPAFAAHAPAGEAALAFQLGGGDDYELCVCLPPGEADAAAGALECGLTDIGVVEVEPGTRLEDSNGPVTPPARAGYNHFERRPRP